jgi:hypothetical protein
MNLLAYAYCMLLSLEYTITPDPPSFPRLARLLFHSNPS